MIDKATGKSRESGLERGAEAGKYPVNDAARLELRLRNHTQLWHAVANAEVCLARLEQGRRIEQASPAMDQLLRAGRLLVQQDCRIDGATQTIDETLEKALLDAGSDARAREVVDRDGRSWELTVIRHDLTHLFSGRSRTVTLVVQQIASEQAARRTLKKRFSLTPAECRCALALPKLGDVPSLARAFGVSKETIRSHMRSILAKTGTANQAELTLLLAREGLIHD